MSELSDDTPLADLLLTSHAEKIVRWAKPPIRTIGDLRKLSDADLLKIEGCGKMAVLEFRLLTGQIKPGEKKLHRSDKVLKRQWLMAVASGQCECAFEDWKKENSR